MIGKIVVQLLVVKLEMKIMLKYKTPVVYLEIAFFFIGRNHYHYHYYYYYFHYFSFYLFLFSLLLLLLLLFLIIQSQAAFVNCLYVARFTIVHSKTQIKFPLLFAYLIFFSRKSFSSSFLFFIPIVNVFSDLFSLF